MGFLEAMFLINRRGQNLPSSFSLYGGSQYGLSVLINLTLFLKNTNLSIIINTYSLELIFTYWLHNNAGKIYLIKVRGG